MNTNHNGHTLRNLTNRVMAVIDDAEHAQAAVDTLERAGVQDVRITVRDEGRGIPAEQRARVGRRFYRAPGTQDREAGLGWRSCSGSSSCIEARSGSTRR